MSSAKKQASILSFFGGGAKSEAKQTTDSKAKTDVTTPSRVFKRINDEEPHSPIRSQSTKRRKIILSSDEETEMENTDNEPATPSTNTKIPIASTPKSLRVSDRAISTPRSSVATPKTSRSTRLDHISTENAESFINSFRLDESRLDDSVVSTATLDESIYQIDSKKKNVIEDEVPIEEQYTHETLVWLKPDNIKDGEGRKASHPDYDPTTLYVPPQFLKEQTPGHRQWWALKSSNFDTILFFKVGKFYELYHMDAVIAVNSLSLSYMRGAYAHCGFPETAYGKFADQLVSRGYKVARVEQTETPQQLEERNGKAGGAKDKVVKRELCRVTTIGTKTYGVLDGCGEVVDDLGESAPKLLMAIKELSEDGGKTSSYGICFVDTSIGKFLLGQFTDDFYRSYLRTLIASFSPVQILYEKGSTTSYTKTILNSMLSSVPKDGLAPKKGFWSPEDTIKTLCREEILGPNHTTWPITLRSILDPDSVIAKADSSSQLVWSAFGAVIGYLKRCLIEVDMLSIKDFNHLDSALQRKTKPEPSETYWNTRNMVLDGVTLENLNLVACDKRDAQAASLSLYNTLNNCLTPGGKRLLRQWICFPSCKPAALRARQEAITWLSNTDIKQFLANARNILRKIPDLDRLMQKVHTLGLKYRSENHPDSRAVMFELDKYNHRKIKELLATLDGFEACLELIKLYNGMMIDGEGCSLLDDIIGNSEMTPELGEHLHHFKQSFDRVAAKENGTIVPEKGRDYEYDVACDAIEEASKDIENYRKNLSKELRCSIAYFGTGKNRYQLEIPDSMNLPKKYELRGSRKGFSRYMTQELEDLIQVLTNAEKEKEKQAADVTRKVFADFSSRNRTWTSVSSAISVFDVLQSLARFALTCGLHVCLPEFVFDSEQPFLSIEEGYHPCLATKLSSSAEVTTTTNYIANDSHLGGDHPLTMLLTGPNMGGKSTLMRQIAVLTVLAHMGAHVPARSMKLTPVDRIFTRIGANDRIMCGQSTFFVEMNETLLVLRDATSHSLVLIDELGRGTSTFDGTAIASAVLDEISSSIGCRCLFSTHYHSLCQTASNNSKIKQAHMACMVENENDTDPTEECVTFLYQLADGICPKSYGFYAAKLAGVSDEVIRSAYIASGRIGNMSSCKIEASSSISSIKEAANNNVSIEELERMVAEL